MELTVATLPLPSPRQVPVEDDATVLLEGGEVAATALCLPVVDDRRTWRVQFAGRAESGYARWETERAEPGQDRHGKGTGRLPAQTQVWKSGASLVRVIWDSASRASRGLVLLVAGRRSRRSI